MHQFLRFSALGIIAIAIWVGYALAAGVFWFHLSQGFGTAAIIALGLLGFALVVAALISRTHCIRMLGLALLPLVAIFFWWLQITPRNDRVWAPELAESVSASVDGSQVTLSNIRNFNWRTADDYDARWETQTYDLDTLESVEAALSYWGIEKIAHVLISFGFANGEQVVFSVEIRKEMGEKFSELGGLFKQFELSLIAAKEEDILYLRTNARDPLEDVYLYPLKIAPKARRALFMSYVQLGNRLVEKPLWYNTITANCTTVVYRLVRSFSPDQGFDPRFVLSGGLPEYFVETDMLDWPEPIGDYRARAAISAKAQAMQSADNYSRLIRGE